MRQLVELNKNIAAFQDSGATLVAISADSHGQTVGLSRRVDAAFSLMADPGNVVSKLYAADIKGAAMYIIRQDGTIHYGYTDPPNYLDRPPLHMVLTLAGEAADAGRSPRTSEFDAPCRPQKGVWICE